MRKIKVILSIIVMTAIILIGKNNEVQAYRSITSQELFEASTFDTLNLNYTSLPNISVTGSTPYNVVNDAGRRYINFTNSAGQTLNATVTAAFNNCGTLNGRAIDMRLVYSDIVTSGANAYLYWTAFGTNMASANEWWYNCVEHMKIEIYFYYHGENTPIQLKNAFLSIYSEDQDEGASSTTSVEEFIYTQTNMRHANSYHSPVTNRTYSDVFYGIASGSTEAGSLNCVAFQYKDTNHLTVELYGLNAKVGIGYHLQYIPLTATLPSDPVKKVDKTESKLGDKIKYTVEQRISMRFDNAFHYSSLVFTDNLNSNLTYDSLKVYNENGVDVTSSAGNVTYNGATNIVTYTFNAAYLQNTMKYTGELYKFEINTTVKNSSTENPLQNSARTAINGAYNLDSNSVSTTLKSRVIVHHVNKLGVKIADDVIINGNLLDTYTTDPVEVYGYKLVENSGNTSGTMVKNDTEVTYTYDLIRVNIDLDKYLEKTDSTPRQVLKGAKFRVKVVEFPEKVALANPDEEYFSVEEGADGHYVVKGVPYGDYKFSEVTIPDVAYDGIYYLNGGEDRLKEFDITVNAEKAYSYELEDVAKKMQITIYKQDKDTQNNVQGDAHLEGAKYGIYRNEDCTDLVEELTIQKEELPSGDVEYKAVSGWYLVGTYYVKETEAPEGYLIDENVYTVEQIPSEQTEEKTSHSITSKDEVMKGLVTVIKYDNNSKSSQKNPAEGAKLRLTLDSNPDVYYEAIIDQYGYLEFVDEETRDEYYPYTIPYGVYTIEEIESSNSGETIFIKPQKTEIKYDKQTQEYILSDEYIRLRLTIQKQDTETKKPIPEGAKFKIWNVNTQSWYEDVTAFGRITEFTTNSEGQITINGHLEAGNYVLYETKAPEGYYLDENLREGSKGYEFRVSVNKKGEVVVRHNDEEEVLEYDEELFDNIPSRVHKYTANVDNMPQKAVVEVLKTADQFTKVESKNTEYGEVKTPIFEKVGLKGVEFELIAAEDITTPDGTVRYTNGQVVSTVVTGEDGIARTEEVYLGKYKLREVSSVNGYVLDTQPIDLDIQYTNDKEKVQLVHVDKENKKQSVKLSFEKIFKELETSKFKFTNKEAIFGIYTKNNVVNYKNENTLGMDELVDIIKTDENNMVKNTVELPVGQYYVKELYVSNPYGKLTDEYEFEVAYKDTLDKDIQVTVNNGKIENIAKTAKLRLIKFSDEDYKNLEIADIKDNEKIKELSEEYGVKDATYKVYNDKECKDPVITNEDVEAEFTTDENGQIYIEDMPYGTYYFKESKSPFGYELSSEVIKVEINDTNTNSEIVKVVKDKLKRAKLLKKYDSFTKDIIKGVEFEITDKEGNVVYSAKTDEKGIVSVPIIYFKNGETYYYQEKKVAKQYELDKEKHEFTAKYDEETCKWNLDTIQVDNNRKTIDELIVRKTDRETGELLEGCKFTIVLLDENGEEYVNENGDKIYLVEDGVTNEKGEYVIKDVPYGTYKFVEITPPEGYELDEDITGLVFTVDENTGDTLIFEVTNTGDIAVIALVCVAVVSVIGIVYVILKNRKKNKEK